MLELMPMSKWKMVRQHCILVISLQEYYNYKKNFTEKISFIISAAVRSACKWADFENLDQLKKSFVLIVQFLLNTVGINIDSRNNIGITPLFFAIDKGTEKVARELIKKGACIDIEVDGDTIEELLEEKMANLLHECSDYNRSVCFTVVFLNLVILLLFNIYFFQARQRHH